jgi:DNA polymerase IV
VTLKLRYADFHTLTHSRTLAPTSSELELYPVLKEMLAAARTRPLPVRLLGVQLSSLGAFEQLSLFDQIEKAATVVDRIREKFGFEIVSLATQLGSAPPPAKLASATPAQLPGGRRPRPRGPDPGR